ncbi:MAG: hypothetical protein JSR45_08935 [Proteobacteria bacterium]|nr:hypothetical protein [Pseudomonadota bacterium]
MTDASDTTPPNHLPPGPRERSPMSPAFFVALSTGLAVVIAGAALAFVLPRFLNKPKTPAAPPAASAPATTEPASTGALQARIAQLQQELEEARAGSAAARDASARNAAELALSARLDRIEAAERRINRAASAAVAASALSDAARTSRPFPAELAAVERLMPQSSETPGLRVLAEQGAPTRAALAAEFPDVAAKAKASARLPAKGSGFLDRLWAGLGSLITVRRIDDFTGQSVDAVLARAERHAAEGDLEGALNEMRALPPGAQRATADWRERARRRVEVETRIAALRAAAMRDLSVASEPGAPQ